MSFIGVFSPWGHWTLNGWRGEKSIKYRLFRSRRVFSFAFGDSSVWYPRLTDCFLFSQTPKGNAAADGQGGSRGSGVFLTARPKERAAAERPPCSVLDVRKHTTKTLQTLWSFVTVKKKTVDTSPQARGGHLMCLQGLQFIRQIYLFFNERN